MPSDVAISVRNVSKTFRIPHEKISSLRGAFVNVFKNKTYEEFKALNDVSFEVKKGEFFGIIGRNGSGKSTLLKVLAGIYQPDKGMVRVNGMISPFLELGIGFNPELSGRDNVYLNATVLGLTKKQIDEKFNSIVAFSELERFIDQRLKNYSSGMQVRLAFSVAIHANRDILLMDEVLAVGDSNFQSKCLEEFNKYREKGRTVIIVTHDIGVVQRYCDRAMLLRNGEIKMIGKAEVVSSEYIYENMSDEEKRLVEEERLKRDGREDIERKMIDKENEKSVKTHLTCEKKARMEEEKKKQEIEAQKIAKVTKVEVLDEHGLPKNVLQTGKKMHIVVHYQINKELVDPIFGIVVKSIFHKTPVFVTNTRFMKIKTGNIPISSKKVIYAMYNYFGTGEYSISPAVAGSDAVSIYDWKENVKRFFVVNAEYNSTGTADFKHDVIIE